MSIHLCQGIGGKKRSGMRVGGGKIRMMGDPFGEFTRWEGGGHQHDDMNAENNGDGNGREYCRINLESPPGLWVWRLMPQTLLGD